LTAVAAKLDTLVNIPTANRPSARAFLIFFAVKAIMSRAILEVEGLNQLVQDGQSSLSILENISFTINQGEAVAIVGASGSGKSTLLGMLAGLDIPSGGAVRFLGQDLTKLNEDKRASLRAEHVGFVFQSFQLLDHLSALENVMLATELTPMPNREKALQGHA
jgi:putative ABC transport system ATP-binding protein